MSKQLFITGIGTDVGKTFIAGLILKKWHDNGMKAAYYKAAMSGNDRGPDGILIPGDASYVQSVSGITQPLEEMCPYVYEHAVSPHLASQLEGNPIQMDRVLQGFDAICDHYDYVTVEGSGGILCPLRFDEERFFLTDFIQTCGFSCLVVADAGLGTINEVGLTISFMNAKKIPVKGIIFNHYQKGNVLHENNRLMCEWITGLKVIACVKENDTDLDLSVDQLKMLYEPVRRRRNV